MAPSSNSNDACFNLPNISHLVTYKLDDSNYMVWVCQFLPILKTNGLLGIVDGTEPCPPRILPASDSDDVTAVNPAFILWERKDQWVLSWFLATLSEKIMITVYGLSTSRQVWVTLSNRYATPSHARINHLRRQLQLLRQGSRTCSEFIQLAKTLASQLAIVGKSVEEEDLISYIVGGLNSQFNPFVTSFSFATKDTSMTLEDFQAELLSYEQLLDNQNATNDSGNFALYSHKPNIAHSKPKFGYNNQRGKQRFPNTAAHNSRPKVPFHLNNRTSSGKPSSGQSTPSSTIRPPCQICGKNNHQALDCFHRMDFSFQGRHPPSELAAMVSTANMVHEDGEWLADSAANNHITADLENLTLQQPYQGTETVTVGNGSGLQIAHTGSSSISTPSSTLQLKNILHCPAASANLLSIQKFCYDNNCFFKLTDSYFLVKDNTTGAILLQGPSEDGLYPMHLQQVFTNKARGRLAMVGIISSPVIWHKRLGHPNHQLLQRILKDQHLPVSKLDFPPNLCVPCQLAKNR
jgi:hypothetical protein